MPTCRRFTGCLLLLAVCFIHPPPAYAADPGPSLPWTPVNAPAYDLGPGTSAGYVNEDATELLVFNNRLYLGMEADNALGARLWRTKAGVREPTVQADWEEVAAHDGVPFGDARSQDGRFIADHVDSLAEFQAMLYASTGNAGTQALGAMVYRSPTGDPGTWISVTLPGFGDPANTQCNDMVVFDGLLCGGTHNATTGAQLWCTSDGTGWHQKNTSGFGVGTPDPTVTTIGGTAVIQDALYVGARQAGPTSSGWQDDTGLLFRTRDLDPAEPTWDVVYTGSVGSYRITPLGELDGFLYIACRGLPDHLQILRSPSGDPDTWQTVALPGIDGTPGNFATRPDGAAIHNGALLVGVSNLATAASVWRTTGTLDSEGRVDWARIGEPGLGHGILSDVGLATFHGVTYAWATNYLTGQRVLKTACPLVETRAVTGLGSYAFPGVGAVITLTAGAPQTLTVHLFPDRAPLTATDYAPLPRTFEIGVAPSGVAVQADLQLAYSPVELAASGLVAADLTLIRYDGVQWEPCPPADLRRDPANASLTCRNCTTFSAWAIAAPETANATRTLALHARRPALGTCLPHAAFLLLCLVTAAARPRRS